ncbi:MAG TPA: thioesterase family protein [Actinomycetota bacterium]|nr:thioesterase family protein [Actinomycetota bacterium]
MTLVHEERIDIRWRDVDHYGHVNNAVYLTYLEEARDAWTRAALGDRFDFVIVRIAIDYRRELSLEDEEVVVRCSGTGFGRTSIRTAERIVTSDGIVRAEAESVIVAHDRERRKARALTDDERSRLDAAIGSSGA